MWTTAILAAIAGWFRDFVVAAAAFVFDIIIGRAAAASGQALTSGVLCFLA